MTSAFAGAWRWGGRRLARRNACERCGIGCEAGSFATGWRYMTDDRGLTPENMQRAANQYLDVSKFVRFTMYPAEAAKPAAPNPMNAAPAADSTAAPAVPATAP